MGPNELGSHLESLRLACGFSLRQAAQQSGLSHGYIRDVELGSKRSNGPRIIPRPQTLRKFAEAYHIDFDELMKIAGHIDQDEKQLTEEFKTVEVNLDDVLFVRVDENHRVQIHLEDEILYESMQLHDYILLEERLENNGFVRLQIGTYFNLHKVKSYDEHLRQLNFSDIKDDYSICITLFRAQIYKDQILSAITRNNEPSSERNSIQRPFLSLRIRCTEM